MCAAAREQLTVHTQNMNENTPTGLSPLQQQYEIQAIISHRGHTIHSGHFVSYVKRSTSLDQEAWFLFDDEQTSRSSFENAIRPVDVGFETPYLNLWPFGTGTSQKGKGRVCTVIDAALLIFESERRFRA